MINLYKGEEIFMDIKETKEALMGLNEVTLLLAKQMTDGLQVTQDLAAVVSELLSNADLKNKLMEAGRGIQLVPAELKDVDLSEGIELVKVQASYVPKLLEAFKK